MKYKNIIIVLGVLIVVLQFLDFPLSWDRAFYAIFGLAIVALAYGSK